MAHTNGIESFWALLKRGDDGTFHEVPNYSLTRGGMMSLGINLDDIAGVRLKGHPAWEANGHPAATQMACQFGQVQAVQFRQGKGEEGRA